MSELFDTTTIITIVIAVFVLLRLRSVLGQRTGNERPPFEPYEIDRRTKSAKPVRDKSNGAETGDGNVVPHPAMKDAKPDEDDGIKTINAYAKPGTKLNKGLKEILEHDPMASEKRAMDMQEGGGGGGRRRDGGDRDRAGDRA